MKFYSENSRTSADYKRYVLYSIYVLKSNKDAVLWIELKGVQQLITVKLFFTTLTMFSVAFSIP